MLCDDMGDKSGKGDPVILMSITSSESNDKKASRGSNKREVKGDPPRDFSKQPAVVKVEKEDYPTAQPLYSTRICSKETSHNHVSSLPKRPTTTQAGSATYILQAVPVNSLPARSIATTAASAAHSPKGVLVNSLPTRSRAKHAGSARGIPQGVPINPLPTRLTVTHAGSARDIPEGVPINPLPTKSTVAHAGSTGEIPEGVPFNLPTRSTVIHAVSSRNVPQGVPINPLPTRSGVAHAGSAGEIPQGVPINLPKRSTVTHVGSSRDIPQGVPINPLPIRSAVSHAGYARYIPKSVSVPVRSIKDVRVLSDVPLYNNKRNRSGSINSYHSMDAMKVKPTIHMLNSSNGKAPVSLSRVVQSDDGETFHVQVAKEASHLSSHDEGESLKKLMSDKTQILAQIHASTTPESNEEVSHVSQLPTVTVAVPGFRSRQGANSKISIANRIRRARINERFELLRELVPHSEEGDHQALMDDIIDHVRYLKLQIKTLSQSTLDSEAIDDPFINLEGFGHYLLDQEMLSPLEEVIGRLMKVDNTAFTQLLESRGLSVMPMGLAGGLFQAM